MAENAAVSDDGYAIGRAVDCVEVSPEKENPEMTEDLRPRFQWFSKPSLNVATVRPLPRSGNSQTSSDCFQMPASVSSSARTSPDVSSPEAGSQRVFRETFTRLCPFSFDLRDSMQRVVREQKLEEMRLRKEVCLAELFPFKANPVRKYKPLVVKQSTRPLTIPRSPFSSADR
ncbi:siaz-interacting nuclear protein [Clarias magur]|uniref:Siaz-interacting nuclear protein n=1 Tax=Clarias magur TaxID=1594786 RepID=A0A8J4X3N9_CLAMG|nr:siaz-interacting nuclear protein [Clarias magur]